MRMYIESLCLILYERNMREPQELKYIGHKVCICETKER